MLDRDRSGAPAPTSFVVTVEQADPLRVLVMPRWNSLASDDLAAVLARCGRAGGFTSADALAAVADYARYASRRGIAPAEIPAAVRRSLTGAVSAAMPVAAFETIARQLVRHATYALIDD